MKHNGKRQATAEERDQIHVDAVAKLRAKLAAEATEQRLVALAHVRALRRSARRLPWWKRPLYWARVWRATG